MTNRPTVGLDPAANFVNRIIFRLMDTRPGFRQLHPVSRLGLAEGQLDVTPTILELLDRPYETMFFGRDLLKTPAGTNRVLVNHNRDIGPATSVSRHRSRDIGPARRLWPYRQVEHYRGDAKNGTLALVAQPDATDQQIERDATALFQSADDLYMKRRYRHTGDR